MPVTEVWSRCQTARFVPAHPGAGLAGRAPGPPASTSSPRAGRQPAAALEVRLDTVALDGLSYRRAGRAVGIFKTAVGDSLDLPLGELAALGFCQPDGTFITSLDDLRHAPSWTTRSWR